MSGFGSRRLPVRDSVLTTQCSVYSYFGPKREFSSIWIVILTGCLSRDVKMFLDEWAGGHWGTEGCLVSEMVALFLYAYVFSEDSAQM